jgi:hypothetical protein
VVSQSDPRIAIVHDSLVTSGGAERVLAFMHEVFPEAPIYTAAYLPDDTYPEFRSAEVRTLPGSWLVNSEGRLKALFHCGLRVFAPESPRLRCDSLVDHLGRKVRIPCTLGAAPATATHPLVYCGTLKRMAVNALRWAR